MIVRVSRFGGGRTADPPAWAVMSRRDKCTIFYGAPDYLIGSWWIDTALRTSYEAVPDDQVPDEVWAALAKWRLTHGD